MQIKKEGSEGRVHQQIGVAGLTGELHHPSGYANCYANGDANGNANGNAYGNVDGNANG